MTSNPMSPGRATPSSAFMFAPSPYTSPPFAWTISAISWMWLSKIPRVFGFVSMIAATSSSIAARTVSGWSRPSGPEASWTTS